MPPLVPVVGQFDDPSTSLDSFDCGPTAAVRILRYNTGEVMWPGDFRESYGDTTGGTTPAQNHRGLIAQGAKAYNESISKDRLVALLVSRMMVSLAGDYDQIPIRLRIQKSFTGFHSINLDGYRKTPQTGEQVYVVDPLGDPDTGYKGAWWPLSDVLAYGRKYTGSGNVNAIWAGPMPWVPAKPTVLVNGTIFLYKMAGVGRFRVAYGRVRVEDRKFSAPASSLYEARGYGGKHDYTKVLDGAYKGAWLRIPSHGITYRRH